MTGQSLDDLSSPAHAGVAPDTGEQHKTDLLEQFYLTLQVTYLAAPPSPGSVVHERIDRLFNSVRSWRNAYEIEQLLCFVISEQQLDVELNRRLAEAHALKLEHIAIVDKELHSETTPPADRRIVYHRLLNDLQWFYAKRVQHRAASKRLLVRVSLLFMVALATFALVLFIQFFAHGPATAAAGQPSANAAAAEGAQGEASTPADTGPGSLSNPAPQGQSTTSQDAGTAATTDQGTSSEPNTTGGTK